MRNFRKFNNGGDSMVGQLTSLIGDEARVAELGDFGSQLGGMFVANLGGSGLSWIVNKIFGKNTPAWLNPNLASALLGGVLAWKLPDILKWVGLDNLSSEFEGKSVLANMRHGATLLFGLSLGVQAIGFAGKKLNVTIPGFSGTSVLNTLSAEIADLGGTTKGVGLLDIWGGGDYNTKIEGFQSQIADLNSKLAEMGMPTARNQKEVYMYAQRLLSYAQVSLDNAKKFVSEEDWTSVESLLSSVKEDLDISQGLLTGLAASPAPAIEAAAPTQAAPAQVVPAQQQVIENVETGQKVQVATPQMTETLVTEKTAIGEPAQTGKAFYLDNILPWAQYVAQQTGWTPTQAAMGFVLKYLANNGHMWAYGPDQVLASRNYAPYNVAGVQNSAPAYAVVTVGGTRRSYKIRNKEGLKNLFISIFGR